MQKPVTEIYRRRAFTYWVTSPITQTYSKSGTFAAAADNGTTPSVPL